MTEYSGADADRQTKRRLSRDDIYRIAATEGTEAADRAVQEMKRQRAAEGANASPNIDRQSAPRRDARGLDHVAPASAAEMASIDAALAELKIGDDADEAQPAPVADRPQVAAPVAKAEQAQAAPVEVEKPIELDADQVAAIEALETRDEAIADAYDPSRTLRRMISEKIAEIEADARNDDREIERARIERKQKLARLRKQRERAKKAKPTSRTKAPRRALPMKHPGYDPMHWKRMLQSLTTWLKLSEFKTNKRAEQLRREDDSYRRRLVKFVELHTYYVGRWGKTPSDASIAKQLRCSEAQVRRAYEISMALFGITGPWHKYRAA